MQYFDILLQSNGQRIQILYFLKYSFHLLTILVKYNLILESFRVSYYLSLKLSFIRHRVYNITIILIIVRTSIVFRLTFVCANCFIVPLHENDLLKNCRLFPEHSCTVFIFHY